MSVNMPATVPQILTLIKPSALTDEETGEAEKLIGRHGGTISNRTRLNARACALRLDTAMTEAAHGEILQILDAQGIDAVLRPDHPAPVKLLICDMDSTMITVECIDELADFVGKKAHVAAITERAMNGELEFEAALTERVALLAGLPETTLAQCYAERIRMSPGARELVQGLRDKGAHCVLVSGGFSFFTSRVAAELGFHEERANRLEVENGALTGRIVPPILGKEAKLAALREKTAQLRIAPEQVLAVGDGANDLPMLLAAGMGVAYRAKPNVQRQARARLNHNDLSALLWLAENAFAQELTPTPFSPPPAG